MNYKDELTKALELLGQDDRVVFIGQGAEYSGSPMFEAVEKIDPKKRFEMPVAEDMQTGIAIGLSLMGYIPMSMHPRMDFLMCCMNQLVNHLDKIDEMSSNRFHAKIIIRVAVGSKYPLDPGAQHCQDYTEVLRCALKNVDIVQLLRAENIVPEYIKALNSEKSSILIEYTSKVRGYE